MVQKVTDVWVVRRGEVDAFNARERRLGRPRKSADAPRDGIPSARKEGSIVAKRIVMSGHHSEW